MIGMLLEGDYEKDIRVQKEAESLVENGVPVTVVCTWKKGQPRKVTVKGVNVIRIGWNTTPMMLGFRMVLTALFFIDWNFYFRIPRLIKEESILHLHAHDLPMVNTALLRRKLIKGKVIFDSHENYPELLEGWFMTKKNYFVELKNKALFRPERWKKHEKKVLPKVDKVIAVVEEMKEKYLRENPELPEDHFLIISNFEKLKFAKLSQNVSMDEGFTFDKDTFYVTYVGGISPVRGLDTVIRSMRILKGRCVDTKFLIVGSGRSSYLLELEELANREGVADRVIFLGYKPFETVNYFMQNSGVNIIPHKKTKHTEHTIPHKLFQIFLSKSPVLVSSCAPLKRYVNENDCGWVFEASDEEDLGRILYRIINTNDQSINTKVQNAYNAAFQNYNWEKEANRLISFYKDLTWTKD